MAFGVEWFIEHDRQPTAPRRLDLRLDERRLTRRSARTLHPVKIVVTSGGCPRPDAVVSCKMIGCEHDHSSPRSAARTRHRRVRRRVRRGRRLGARDHADHDHHVAATVRTVRLGRRRRRSTTRSATSTPVPRPPHRAPTDRPPVDSTGRRVERRSRVTDRRDRRPRDDGVHRAAGRADFSLETDGLGAVSFGADPDGVITFVTSFLGGATADTGWVDPFTIGACGGTQLRQVTWGDLQLEFGDVSNIAEGRPHFYAYYYGKEGSSTASPAGSRPPTASRSARRSPSCSRRTRVCNCDPATSS